MIIYRLLNKINGKCYIGCAAKTLEKRMREHLCAARKGNPRYLYCAIRKYGIQSFEISVIDTAETYPVLLEKERYWISFYDSMIPRGYNLTSGGEGTLGHKFSPEQLKRLSESHKGYQMPEERREMTRVLHKGKPETETTKRAISVGVKKHWEKRRALGLRNGGRPRKICKPQQMLPLSDSIQ